MKTLRDVDPVTLPASWYTDPAVLELELRAIFDHAWQYVGAAAHLTRPGDYITAELAGPVPVVVVMDRDGALRGHVNVCPHRGAVVAEGRGHCKALVCPDHSWTFGLDGALVGAPRSEREGSFDAAELGLVPVKVETWGPFVFANLDLEAPPLAEGLGDTADMLAEAGLDSAELEPWSRTPFDMRANWKVVAENYLECYHCPPAHPGFSRVVEVGPDSYRLRSCNLMLSAWTPLRGDVASGKVRAPYETRGPIRESQFHMLWPAASFNTMPGIPNLMMYSWIPLSPGRTLGHFEYHFPKGVKKQLREEFCAFFDQVGYEDVGLVESVQRGLESGKVPVGRLLLDSEWLIKDFQDKVRDALAGVSPSDGNGKGAKAGRAPNGRRRAAGRSGR